jgi:hypothetical protein
MKANRNDTIRAEALTEEGSVVPAAGADLQDRTAVADCKGLQHPRHDRRHRRGAAPLVVIVGAEEEHLVPVDRLQPVGQGSVDQLPPLVRLPPETRHEQLTAHALKGTAPEERAECAGLDEGGDELCPQPTGALGAGRHVFLGILSIWGRPMAASH